LGELLMTPPKLAISNIVEVKKRILLIT